MLLPAITRQPCRYGTASVAAEPIPRRCCRAFDIRARERVQARVTRCLYARAQQTHNAARRETPANDMRTAQICRARYASAGAKSATTRWRACLMLRCCDKRASLMPRSGALIRQRQFQRLRDSDFS